MSLYAKAGIMDVGEFYADKFAYDSPVRPVSGENCYKVDSLKDMWVISNMRPNAKVLDFGCGSGRLGFLSEMGCELTGLDYSHPGVEWALKINNYTHGFAGPLSEFVWEPGYFDYIISMDVFGHVPFEEKDAAIGKLKKLLKPDGIMLHGIECGPVDYDSMNPERLAEFIRVDGHVGIESKSANYARFARFFKHVDGEVRYVVSNSIMEHIKRIKQYDSHYDPALAFYLENLDVREKKAFDIASGLAQLELEKHNIASDDSDAGFLFLRASDYPLESLRYRIEEFNSQRKSENSKLVLNNDLIFDSGWFPYEVDLQTRKSWRWGGPDNQIKIPYVLHGGEKSRLYLEFEVYGSQQGDAIVTIIDNSDSVPHNFEVKTGIVQQLELVFEAKATSLRIVSSSCGMPAADGRGNDSRLLGIKIYEFRMEPAAADDIIGPVGRAMPEKPEKDWQEAPCKKSSVACRILKKFFKYS